MRPSGVVTFATTFALFIRSKLLFEMSARQMHRFAGQIRVLIGTDHDRIGRRTHQPAQNLFPEQLVSLVLGDPFPSASARCCRWSTPSCGRGRNADRQEESDRRRLFCSACPRARTMPPTFASSVLLKSFSGGRSLHCLHVGVGIRRQLHQRMGSAVIGDRQLQTADNRSPISGRIWTGRMSAIGLFS